MKWRWLSRRGTSLHSAFRAFAFSPWMSHGLAVFTTSSNAAEQQQQDGQKIFTEPSIVESISELRADLAANGLPSSRSFKFHVVEITDDGTILELVKTPFDMRLQPRDVSLFTSDPRFSKQRATIAARDGIILFRTETCKAIITPTRATIFPLKTHGDTVRLVENVLSRVMQNSVIPFEFRVLESMLEATTVYFEKKAKRLRLLLESVIAEINAQNRTEANVSEFQRLFPIRRALTEMLFDVKETREAIAETVDNEKMLVAICLTEQLHSTLENHHHHQVTKHMKLASALLDSYERQVETVEGALKEIEDNMNDAREVWHMQMDSIRNRIIRINLTISIASFSLLLSTVPAGFFGMNLINGLESTPAVFSTVVYSCVIMTVMNYLLFYGYYRYWPERRHQQRLTDMKALKDILSHHIDGLDELLLVLHEKPKLGRIEFDRIVHENVQDSQQMSKGEIDLLYRMFYTNREGLLEVGEHLISPIERSQSTGRF